MRRRIPMTSTKRTAFTRPLATSILKQLRCCPSWSAAMPIDLSQDQLQCVRRIVRRHVPDAEVWVFGSRAGGACKPHSDLDLAIVSDAPVPIRQMALLADELAESDLPFRVDVVDWATTSDSFRRLIAKSHEI